MRFGKRPTFRSKPSISTSSAIAGIDFDREYRAKRSQKLKASVVAVSSFALTPASRVVGRSVHSTVSCPDLEVLRLKKSSVSILPFLRHIKHLSHFQRVCRHFRTPFSKCKSILSGAEVGGEFGNKKGVDRVETAELTAGLSMAKFDRNRFYLFNRFAETRNLFTYSSAMP